MGSQFLFALKTEIGSLLTAAKAFTRENQINQRHYSVLDSLKIRELARLLR